MNDWYYTPDAPLDPPELKYQPLCRICRICGAQATEVSVTNNYYCRECALKLARELLTDNDLLEALGLSPLED